jgi:hypothetical protein
MVVGFIGAGVRAGCWFGSTAAELPGSYVRRGHLAAIVAPGLVWRCSMNQDLLCRLNGAGDGEAILISVALNAIPSSSVKMASC